MTWASVEPGGWTPRARWHCAALRSFASLLLRVAERLDRGPESPFARETAFPLMAPEERILDLRHRVHSRYY